jgi:hypothetical protein
LKRKKSPTWAAILSGLLALSYKKENRMAHVFSGVHREGAAAFGALRLPAPISSTTSSPLRQRCDPILKTCWIVIVPGPFIVRSVSALEEGILPGEGTGPV